MDSIGNQMRPSVDSHNVGNNDNSQVYHGAATGEHQDWNGMNEEEFSEMEMDVIHVADDLDYDSMVEQLKLEKHEVIQINEIKAGIQRQVEIKAWRTFRQAVLAHRARGIIMRKEGNKERARTFETWLLSFLSQRETSLLRQRLDRFSKTMKKYQSMVDRLFEDETPVGNLKLTWNHFVCHLRNIIQQCGSDNLDDILRMLGRRRPVKSAVGEKNKNNEDDTSESEEMKERDEEDQSAPSREPMAVEVDRDHELPDAVFTYGSINEKREEVKGAECGASHNSVICTD